MGIDITVQFIAAEPSAPPENKLVQWARSALDGNIKEAEITLRITDEDEIQSLNDKWRHIDEPTNVLSFPLNDAGGPPSILLGDIVICAPIIKQEAAAQNKSLPAHWAHMIIHGILHLMSYDHVKDKDAKIMEEKEISILKTLGFPNPYLNQ